MSVCRQNALSLPQRSSHVFARLFQKTGAIFPSFTLVFLKPRKMKKRAAESSEQIYMDEQKISTTYFVFFQVEHEGVLPT